MENPAIEKEEKPRVPLTCSRLEIHNFSGVPISIFTYFFNKGETVTFECLDKGETNGGAKVSITPKPFPTRNEEVFTEFLIFLKQNFPEAEVLYY